MILSPHAKRRRKQMRVTEHEIERALAEPELVWPSRYGRWEFVRGRIAVVTEADKVTVATVLWHRAECRRDGPQCPKA